MSTNLCRKSHCGDKMDIRSSYLDNGISYTGKMASLYWTNPDYSVMSYQYHSCWCHDAWWRHQMETFSTLLAICAGNSPVPGEFPSQRPVTRSVNVLICVWINDWVNNREASDLRCYRAHYDVIVMYHQWPLLLTWFNFNPSMDK